MITIMCFDSRADIFFFRNDIISNGEAFSVKPGSFPLKAFVSRISVRRGGEPALSLWRKRFFVRICDEGLRIVQHGCTHATQCRRRDLDVGITEDEEWCVLQAGSLCRHLSSRCMDDRDGELFGDGDRVVGASIGTKNDGNGDGEILLCVLNGAQDRA